MNGEETWKPRRSRLVGQRVVIFAISPASEPSSDIPRPGAFRSSPILETEETVISFLRAFLAEGAEVTLIADEPLALLGATVAGEYVRPFLEEHTEQPPPRLNVVLTERRGEEDDPFTLLERLGHARVTGSRDVYAAIERVPEGARAVVVAGGADADAIGLLRARAPRNAFYAVAATGVPWQYVDDLILIDERVRSDGPFVARRKPEELVLRAGDAEHEQEYEYPLVALAAQFIVERLQSDDERPPRLIR
jgi:hypothetical protein